ncbi:MAG: alpha/beta hydrolase, partial [Caldilineaceae bacterium]|nr:alpha/beta hydrolase [Caldilineaceae bacterium]
MSTELLTTASLASEPFSPHPWLRHGHVQTLLSRIKPRQATPLFDQPLLVDGGPDYCDLAALEAGPRNVQLLAYFTPHSAARAIRTDDIRARAHDNTASVQTPLPPRRGLVLLLHGWEGCSHSNYNLALTGTLTAAGFDVIRLNLRDHGPGYDLDPYALNPGIFLGVLIDEAAHAIRQIAALAGSAPFYIVGASMGGNFALRLAAHHAKAPFHNLRKVVAVNPAVNPGRATDLVDAYPFYRRYFRRRWFDSLLAKQRLFPQLYDFTHLHAVGSIRAMTEWLIRHYGHRFVGFPAVTEPLPPFQCADEYFSAYAVHPHTLAHLTVATEIISSLDDPIIDVDDICNLPPHPLLTVQLHP